MTYNKKIVNKHSITKKSLWSLILTAKDITKATFKDDVTAKAEQIPKTCKVIGLLSTRGSTSNCFLV